MKNSNYTPNSKMVSETFLVLFYLDQVTQKMLVWIQSFGFVWIQSFGLVWIKSFGLVWIHTRKLKKYKIKYKFAE